MDISNCTICKNHPYGEHIVLKCANHPEKKWTTKNIGYIGARSFFYVGPVIKMGNECNCPIEALVHDKEEECEGKKN